MGELSRSGSCEAFWKIELYALAYLTKGLAKSITGWSTRHRPRRPWPVSQPNHHKRRLRWRRSLWRGLHIQPSTVAIFDAANRVCIDLAVRTEAHLPDSNVVLGCKPSGERFLVSASSASSQILSREVGALSPGHGKLRLASPGRLRQRPLEFSPGVNWIQVGMRNHDPFEGELEHRLKRRQFPLLMPRGVPDAEFA